MLSAVTDPLRRYGPGLALVGVLALASKLLSAAVQPWFELEALTIGILLGVLIANTLGMQDNLRPGVQFALKKLLKVGIVLLGFKLDFAQLAALGPKLLTVVLLWVPAILILSIWLGRRFGLGEKLAVLIGVGSSICGASAIVAMAPSIQAEDEDALMAVGVVSLLGAVGVLAYSAIAAVSPMTDAQFGLWSGLTLQGVAHALAGAFARGPEAGQLGTVIKMARVLMLVPMTVALVMRFAPKHDAAEGGLWRSARESFPGYVLLFILAGLIRTLGLSPAVGAPLGWLSGLFILMAMIAMGLMVHLATLRAKGGQAVLMGGLLFVGLSGAGYGLVLAVF